MLTLAPNQVSMLTVIYAFTTFTAGIAVALSTHSARGWRTNPGCVPLLRGMGPHLQYSSPFPGN